MPQNTDIVLNGAGYMVEPGSYKRLQDGMAEGRTERIALTDFFGGQTRALQLERDKFYDSLAVGPALNGQGVQPWGEFVTKPATAMSVATPDQAKRIPYAIVRDRLWFAIGTRLYSLFTTLPDYIDPATNLTLVKTYPNPIVDLCIYGSKGLLVTFGAAADIEYYDTISGTAVVLFATERGSVIVAYAGFAAWSDARASSRPTIIRLVTGTGFDHRAIDHDPIRMTTVGAEMITVTKQALYSYTGRVKEVTAPGGTGTVMEWTNEFTPYFQQGVYADQDDYRILESYGGRVLAWIAGGVHEQIPSGDRAGWRSTGLTGRRCFGGCIAGGYLIACIESHSGQNEVWAYDGNGWWRLMAQPMPGVGVAGTWCNPMPIGQAVGYRNVMIFLHGSTDVIVMRLNDAVITTGEVVNKLAANATFLTPLIDANERDKPKAWRKVGAVFASPQKLNNLGGIGDVGIALDYSIDGGANWTMIDTRILTGNTIANMNVELTGTLSAAISTFVQLRVRWWNVSDWAPILTGVWAEYEVLHNPARRRRWEFKVHARDQEVDRDGLVFSQGDAAIATTNVIVNPRAGVNANGWTPETSVTATRTAWVNGDTPWCVEVVNADAVNYGGVYAPVQGGILAPASPGQSWSASCDIAGGSNVRLKLIFFTAAYAFLGEFTIPDFTAPAGGDRYTVSGIAPAATELVGMLISTEASTTMKITRAQLEQLAAASPYADGSLPGCVWTGTAHASSTTRAYNDGFRTGRELIAELWSAWQNDTAETFRDLDYDSDPVERTVRIVGISESVAQPADSNHWGDSTIALKLVEV